MICKKCQKPLSDDALFCTNCGAKVETESEDNSKPIEQPPITETSEPCVTPDNSETTENSSQNSSTNPIFNESESLPEYPEATVSDTDSTNYAEVNSDDLMQMNPQPETTSDNDKIPKRITAGRITGSVFISVFAVIFLILLNLLLSTRIGLSSDIVRSSANSLSMETILDYEIEDGKTTAQYIYDNTSSDFINASGAKVKDIRSIIIKSDFKSFIADTLENYSAYIINGSTKNDPSVTCDDIVSFLEDNEKVFNSELYNYEMTKDDYECMVQGLKDEDFDELLSVKEWSDEIGFSLGTSHFLFSFITIGIVLALVLVCFIWIVIILDKRGRHITGFFGNILLISGLVCLIPSVAFFGFTFYANVFAGNAAAYFCTKILIPLASIAGCTGLFEVIVGVILKKIKKHIKKSELSKLQ